MPITIVPAPASGGIKLVQRGTAVSSGAITITAVDTTKAFVRSFSNDASGNVAINSSTSGTLTPSGGTTPAYESDQSSATNGTYPSLIGSRALSGGTTSLTTKLFGVYLTNSTTLTATGACYWEVVEYL
jgi:hypothetical protein